MYIENYSKYSNILSINEFIKPLDTTPQNVINYAHYAQVSIASPWQDDESAYPTPPFCGGKKENEAENSWKLAIGVCFNHCTVVLCSRSVGYLYCLPKPCEGLLGSTYFASPVLNFATFSLLIIFIYINSIPRWVSFFLQVHHLAVSNLPTFSP